MAGELNFTAGINLDENALAQLEQEIKRVIKNIESDGTLIDKAFNQSIKAVSVTAENASKGLEQGSKGAKAMATELDNATVNAEELKEAIGNELSNKLNNLASMAAKFGMAFGAEELIRKIINVRGEFQQLEIAFGTMLGSEEKANILMQELTATAAKTPFDMQGIAQGAKQLLAYGTASEDVNSTLVHLGDIAAGLSIPLNDLVYLYGTTMAQGQMFTQDLKQMQGRGILIADEIAKILKVSKEAVPAMVSAGRVTADVFQKAILAMSSEGGKFYNLMEKQSASLTGQISNLEDAFDQLLNSLGKESEGALSMGIGAITTLVEGLGKIAPILLNLTAVYGAYKAAIIAVNTAHKIQASWNAIILAGKAANAAATKGQILYTTLLTKAQKALNAAMLTNPWVIAATAVAALSVGLYALANAEKGEEKGIKKAREEHQKYQEQLAESANKSKGFFATLKDNTKSIEEHVKAWEELNKQTKAFEGMSMEEILKMSEQEFTAKLKEYNDKQAEQKNKSSIDILEAEVKRLEGEIKGVDDFIESETDRILKKNIENNKNASKLFQKTTDREEIREDVRQNVMSSASGQVDRKNIRQYKANKELLEEKKGELKVAKEIEEQRLKMKEAGEKAAAVKNKEYWEKQKKNEEANLANLDESKKGSKEWNDIVKKIEEAEKHLKAWDLGLKQAESKTKKIKENIEKFKVETSADVDAIKYDMKLNALKQELEYETRIVEKEKIQKQINEEILDKKKAQMNEETEKKIQSTIGAEDYAKYVNNDETLSQESKNAIAQIKAIAQEEINAMEAQFIQEANIEMLATRVKAYEDYAKEVLRIEQEKADRIKEIEEDKDLSDEEKESKKTIVTEETDYEKKLLSASSGIGSDIVAEVETLVNDIMGYSANEILTQLETINGEINAKIEELQTSLEGDIPNDQRVETEKQINTLKTKQNLLIQKGTTLAKKQSKESKKSQGETKKWINLSEEQADAIGASSQAFDAVGDVADEVLSECGDLMSDTAKDALQAISSIANFASTAMDLITQTAQITDTTSKSIMASNIIGWIMLAVQMLVKLATFLAQYSAENQLKAEIEALGEEIELAELKFENLEKKIKLSGSIGTKAFKEEIMLAEEMNDTIDLQNQKYAKTQELLELQRQKYGESSEKYKETQKELMELEGEKYDVLQDQADRYQEIFEELATTDVTSFAEDMASSMVDGFAEGLRGMERAYDETIKNLIKEQLTKQLSLELIDKMKPAFDKLKKSTQDGDLDTNEIDEFKRMIDSTKESGMAIAEKYRELMGSYGLLDDAELEAESRGFEAMSQDTADELNGRFTALQMSGANIDQNTLLMTQQNVELLNHSRSIAEQATISTQIAQQQLYELREIKDNTAVLHSLDDRLRNIESYTSKL